MRNFLILALLALAGAARAEEAPAPPRAMVVVEDATTKRDEPPPHGNIGMSTAYRISDAVPGRIFEFRRRILHLGAAIGGHKLAHDEVYHVLGGEGVVESDGDLSSDPRGDDRLSFRRRHGRHPADGKATAVADHRLSARPASALTVASPGSGAGLDIGHAREQLALPLARIVLDPAARVEHHRRARLQVVDRPVRQRRHGWDRPPWRRRRSSPASPRRRRGHRRRCRSAIPGRRACRRPAECPSCGRRRGADRCAR